MIRNELKIGFRTDMAPELIARAWGRMHVTSDISLTALRTFVANAQRVGFLRSVPDLSRLVEAP